MRVFFSSGVDRMRTLSPSPPISPSVHEDTFTNCFFHRGDVYNVGTMVVEPSSPVRLERPPTPPRLVRRRAQRSRWVRVRWVATIAALLCLVPALVSYVSAIAQRSDSSLGIRTVEWIRDNGARGLVTTVENWYYTLTAPAKSFPAPHALPKQSGILAVRPPAARLRVRHYRPPSIVPVIRQALPGEGVWHATFAGGGSQPPVLITSYRPNPDYPRLVAGVAWIDHTRTSVRLYPGLQEPAVAMPSRGPMEVPQARRGGLVATFNSGFKLSDARGGFAYGGHTYVPMIDGISAIVRYTSGKVDVVGWTGGPDVGGDVAYARQNLPLIVNHGRPNPNLSDGPAWGATLGNAVFVWRSAVGVDRYGNVIYAAAPDQTVSSLAQIMVRAGAVRAMQIDINSYWPSFITYRFPGAGQPANLLPDMVRSPFRYLTPRRPRLLRRLPALNERGSGHLAARGARARPKFLLELLGAPHLPPYTDEQPQLGIVEHVTTAFLDRYLKHGHGALRAMIRAGNLPAWLRSRPNRDGNGYSNRATAISLNPPVTVTALTDCTRTCGSLNSVIVAIPPNGTSGATTSAPSRVPTTALTLALSPNRLAVPRTIS
jgi:Phosphodiester glycosidase